MLSAEEKLFIDAFKQKLLYEPDTYDLNGSLITSFMLYGQQVIDNDYGNRKEVFEISNNLKKKCIYIFTHPNGDEALAKEAFDTVWDLRLFEARNRQLDSYLLYLEKNRDPKEKFYQPKRKHFYRMGIIQALQQMLDDELDILTISLPPGTQKCQPLYSKVLTPNGFVEMRNINPGDKVIAANGCVTDVLSVSPINKRAIYEITLDDGSKVRASDNHLWKVQTRDDRNRGKYRVVETSDMLKNFMVENGRRCNYSLDYVEKIEFPQKNFIIHPYIMGVIIGDGGIAQSGTIISTADEQILERIERLLPNGYKLSHKGKYDYIVVGHEGNNPKQGSVITKELVRYGLKGKKSIDKFIPKDYLYSSYYQRLDLLRGLMDTDGSASKGYCVYATISPQLADDVAELVHSLGGYASINKRKAGYRKNGEYIRCNDYFELLIQFPSGMDSIFYLDRKSKKYNPKRRLLRRFIKDIKYVGEEECKCILIDDPSHLYITDNYIITHNTTCEKFFLSGVIGWFPSVFNLFFSHSSDITRMFYDGVLNIVSDDLEYTWKEIFPDLTPNQQNAKMQQFNVGKYKPFPSVQCTTAGSENAGKVRCNGYLLVDDLIGKLEEALNKNTLDKLWGIYSVDARQRKMDGCKEIHIATRWSVHDVIGRLQVLYEGNARCKFIAFPDIDPVTGKSNFDYDYNGFSVEFFHDQELAMDDISYRCLYKNDPIEREGLLYHEDELRRYYSLPAEEPDAIIGVCDTKSTGIDYMVLPVLYKYNEDYYMVDCICDDSSDFGVQKERLSNIILDHNVQQCEFESNAGGDRLANDVADIVRKNGGRCNVTTKATETNKETRIIVNSDWVKKNVLFKDMDSYTKKSDYGRFMSFLTSYSVAGKNKFDDVPDCMANFALFVTRSLYRRKTRIMKSPI